MIRPARWFTIGFVSTILFVAGCSGNSNTPTSTAQPSASTAEPSVDISDSANADSADTQSDEVKTASRPVDNVTLQPGSDPLAIVFASRLPSSEQTGTELIKVAYPNPQKAVVTITKTGLPDDSIAATRTRYDFKPVEGTAEGAKQWELMQVTEQNKCQPDRGAQDWTGDLCQ